MRLSAVRTGRSRWALSLADLCLLLLGFFVLLQANEAQRVAALTGIGTYFGAIAAPVFGPSASLLGAISVSGPLERFSELAVERMKTLVIAAAQRATQSLGGKWPGA